MDYMPYYSQMLSPQQCGSPLMQYPAETLEDMYPDIYVVIYPKIRDACMVYDVPGAAGMYPYPSREMVDRMTDDIYNATVTELGIPDEEGAMKDSGNRQFGFADPYGYGAFSPYGYGVGYPYYGFGRRSFLRDLIAILLIRNLLGRRGFHHY